MDLYTGDMIINIHELKAVFFDELCDTSSETMETKAYYLKLAYELIVKRWGSESE